MKKIKYSPSDIANFEICKCHIIYKVLRRVKGAKIPEKEKTKTEIEYQRQGEEIEATFLSKIKLNGFDGISRNKIDLKIIKGHSTDEKIKNTEDSILSGNNIIYQACLSNDNLIGYPDFLVKSNQKNEFEVLDVKRSKEPKKSHVTQIQAYNFLLKESKYNSDPENFHIINSTEHTHNQFKVNESYESFIELKNDFLNFVFEIEKKTVPELMQLLDEVCVYNINKLPKCETIPANDDLINVVGLNKKQKKILKPLVKNIEGLSKFKSRKMKGISEVVLEKLIEQAGMQYTKIKNQKSEFKLLPQIENKGFCRLPKLSKNDLFFDIEGDPTIDGGHEYLFGIIDNSLDNFKSFWAEEYDQEKKAFEAVLDFLKNHIIKYPESHIYHYNHYEVTSLKRLSIKYDDMEILDFLLRNNKFIDLYPITRESLITSEKGLSIKDLEIFYMDKRETEVTSGADSVDQFLEWKAKHNRNDDKEILRQIESYNRDDCKSTKLLLDWLHVIKPENVNIQITNELKPLIQESNIEYKKAKKQILSTKSEEMTIKELVSDMLEFHKREEKSEWWLFFDRGKKDYQELINDMEAIADCKKIKYFKNDKGNPNLELTYPNQFFKIKTEKEVVSLDDQNLSTLGKIIKTDIENNRIIIQTAKTKPIESFPSHFNLGAKGPIPSKKLRASLYRLADSFYQNKAPKNILDLLNISKPSFKNNYKFDESIKQNEFLKFTTKALINLNNSYLFIQGPPGSGKTYTTAFAIIELLKIGKKIAITSNSHKAINQVLETIDKLYQQKEEKFKFKGIKKSSDTESRYESLNIENSTSSLKYLKGDYQLLAATKYELCNKDYDGIFDYVFIDEAGQFSIADAIVCALSGQNLVLIGDPKQLNQPSSISHPGKSGLSALEYILNNQNTVKEGYGIFIDQTRRMNKKINSFISATFYDDRLISHNETLERNLIIDNYSSSLRLPNEGIVLVETDHEDNAQNSDEEIDIIKKIFNFLLNQNITIKEKTRKIVIEDILVIAPYNVQVNSLSERLPPENRTGTIHNFQGQEAPISIVSMTASDDDNAPRGINFLFDPRSLNVAISRAQCLSIVIMNKKLFKANASNVAQIKMINNFHKLRTYAHRIEGKLFT